MKNKKCSLWFCDRKHYARGYCHAHWTARRRYGSPYGKHWQEYQKYDEVIQLARKIALDMQDNILQTSSYIYADKILKLTA